MRFIRHLLFVSGIILCSSSSFGQSSFGFREMASDSILIAEEVCDICIESILYHRRFEIVKNKVDTFAYAKGEFNCLSPNNGVSAYQFYFEPSDFDSLIEIYNHITLRSILLSQKYSCDSTLKYNLDNSLFYSEGYFLLHEIEDSIQFLRFALYDKSVKDIYSLFLAMERFCNDKESVSFKEIQKWTKYFRRRYLGSRD